MSQPRVTAIEKSEDVTVSLLTRYVEALGGKVEINAVIDGERTTIVA